MSLYAILDEIRIRTPMYIGEASITCLRSFLLGIDFLVLKRCVEALPESPPFEDFHDWVASKYGWCESTAGWAKIILAECQNDERLALERFFADLDQFRGASPRESS